LIHFLFISLGSASEIETQLIISHRLNFLKDDDLGKLNNLNIEIIKMLASLIKTKNNGTLKKPEINIQ